MAYIYKITNLINNKIYVGETSRTIQARWKQHQRQAKDGEISHLHCAMRLYGIDNFKIEEVEFCSAEERFTRETYYINYYNSLEPNGYNWILAQNGPNSYLIEAIYDEWESGKSLIAIGNKLHIDPKRASKLLQGCGISQAEIYKRRNLSIGEHSSKSIIQYTLDGEFIEEYKSASEAARQLNINVASICKNASGNLLSYSGFIWQYKEDDNIEEIVINIKNKPKSGKNKKSISQYDLNGEYIQTFESASAAGRSLNKSHSSISYAARNNTNAYGYKWKYNN